MFQGNDQCFMEVFRGKCNFIQSSGVSAGVRRKGTSSQPGREIQIL